MTTTKRMNQTNVACDGLLCTSADHTGEDMFTVGKAYRVEMYKGHRTIVDDNGRHHYPYADVAMLHAVFSPVKLASGVDWGLLATPEDKRINPAEHTYQTRSGRPVVNIKIELFCNGNEVTHCVKGSIEKKSTGKRKTYTYHTWMLDGRNDFGGRQHPLDLVCDDQPLDRDWGHGYRGEVKRTDGSRMANGERYLMSSPFKTLTQAAAWCAAFTDAGEHQCVGIQKCRCLKTIILDVEGV